MRMRIIAAVMALGLVAACSKKDAPSEAPSQAASASPTKLHAAEPHAHSAPHGGLVESTPRGHIELVAERGGTYRVYLLDEDLNLRPVDGASGTVKVAKGGHPDVKLASSGDHLVGQGPEHSDDHLTMVVTVVRDGKPEVARFSAHLEAHGHGPEGASPAARRLAWKRWARSAPRSGWRGTRISSASAESGTAVRKASTTISSSSPSRCCSSRGGRR